MGLLPGGRVLDSVKTWPKVRTIGSQRAQRASNACIASSDSIGPRSKPSLRGRTRRRC